MGTTDPPGPQFVCAECGGRTIPGLEISLGERRMVLPKARLCEACERKQEDSRRAAAARRAQEARQWREQHIGELLLRAGVPPRYHTCTLGNFRGRLPRERPAFISGPPGVGKTHLAVAYLREELIERGRQAGRFLRAVDFFKEVKSTFGDRDYPEAEKAVLNLYGRETPLLVLDDLGTEKISDWVEQTLYDLIDARYAHCLPVIVTSNLTLEGLAAHYPHHGDRLASRLAGMGTELEIRGEDQRLK